MDLKELPSVILQKKAEVTSAALYRHCTDKEDLFCQLVETDLKKFRDWRKNHISTKYGQLEKNAGITELLQGNNTDMIREVIYPNRETFRLLLTKARGTRYENFLHDIVKEDQKEMLDLLSFLKSRGNDVTDFTEKEMHTILSAAYTAMLEPIIHDCTLEETEHCLLVIENFFMPGWKKIMGF